MGMVKEITNTLFQRCFVGKDLNQTLDDRVCLERSSKRQSKIDMLQVIVTTYIYKAKCFIKGGNLHELRQQITNY
jgi:hypothetical protein